MAKSNKQGTKQETVRFGNIAKADSQFNDKKEKDYIIIVRIDKDMYNEFKYLQYKFTTKATGVDWDASNAKLFFKFILYAFRDELKKNGQYLECTDAFYKAMHRKGRRKSGRRSVPVKGSIATTIGPYTDNEVKETHLNVCYSLAQLDNEEHFFEYSFLYFFFDIFYFMRENIDRLIKENK